MSPQVYTNISNYSSTPQGSFTLPFPLFILGNSLTVRNLAPIILNIFVHFLSPSKCNQSHLYWAQLPFSARSWSPVGSLHGAKGPRDVFVSGKTKCG